MASSSNQSISSSAGTVSASYIRYKNRLCKCGVRAAVKISESTPNPGRLYYKYGNVECDFWAWCNPEGGTVTKMRWDGSNERVAFKDDIIDVIKEESLVIRSELKEYVHVVSRKTEAQVKETHFSYVVVYVVTILLFSLITIVISRF